MQHWSVQPCVRPVDAAVSYTHLAILASYSIVGILAYGASAAFVMIAALLGIGAISTAMIGIEPKLLSLEEAAAVPAD